MTRLAMLILAGLAIMLGGIIAMEATPGTLNGAAPRPADIVRPEPVAPHGGDMKQVQAWADLILARPLFEPSRRPLASVAGSAISGPGFPRLTGIIIMPQQRKAIFAVMGKAQPIVVTVGSRLNGVLIKSIEAGSVIVVDAAGTRVIRPSFVIGKTPAASAPASVTVDLPTLPSSSQASPFASIRGLSGRPLGLAAEPNNSPPNGGVTDTAPSLPALATPGGSP